MRSDVSLALEELDLLVCHWNLLTFEMFLEYLLMAILEFLGLLDTWVLITLGVYGCILYFHIVSGSICIDFKVSDCQFYCKNFFFVLLIFKQDLLCSMLG